MNSRLVVSVLSAALLAACGAEKPTAPDAVPAPETGAQAAGQSTSPVVEKPKSPFGFGPNRPGATSPVTVGVAECDDFLAKYEACVADKVPEESRGAMQTALETWRGSWRTLAASPTTRGNLPQMCQAAADSARTQLTSYGCAL